MIFRYIRGLLTEVPLLKAMIERETADSFDLDNGVTIEVHDGELSRRCAATPSWRRCATRSRSGRTDDAAEPDHEVLNAIRPAMSTIPNAMLLARHRPTPERARCSRPTAVIMARTVTR